MNLSQSLRAGAISALAGVLLLLVMVAVGLPAQAGLAALGSPLSPEALAAIRSQGEGIVRLMALDNLFVIAYTGAFLGAAALVWNRSRWFSAAGLLFALLLALLDLSENAVTVDLTRAVLAGVPLPALETVVLSLLEQVKYASGALVVAFFAVAILLARPASPALRSLTAVLYLGFPLVNALSLVFPAAKTLLILWMLLMLLASAILLWKSQAPGASP